jgi:hypothetical protein
MKRILFLELVLLGCALTLARAQVTIQPVALAGQAAPGLTNNAKFSAFGYLSLADDGRVAFTANISGSGVVSTNNSGLWAGLPSDLRLLARTGDMLPGAAGDERLQFIAAPNIDNSQAVGFLSTHSPTGPLFFKLLEFAVIYSLAMQASDLGSALAVFSSFNGHVREHVAGRAELSGPGIDASNNLAIVAGPPTNAAIVAQKSSPAPGGNGNFTFFPLDSRALALAPDGNVAFYADAADGTGIWYGQAGTVQKVAQQGKPAPDTLLGPGHTFAAIGPSGYGSILAVNGRGELAFAANLAGPGLTATNSAFLIAGTPSNLHYVARSGQPAPGIPGSFFTPAFGNVFGDVLLGPNGAVAFTASYSTNAYDYGLWLAATNGTSTLLMRNSAQAPGTPTGVVFRTPSFLFLPPYEQAFMNMRDQVAFRAYLSGPGIGNTNDAGIWMVEPDGGANLIARAGDTFQAGDGVPRRWSSLYFGSEPESLAGPQDGRRSPFNDRGDLLFIGSTVGSSYGGLFLASSGFLLTAERAGNDIRLRFPTLTDNHYRVDYSPNLPTGSWSVLVPSVTGSGTEISVIDTNAASFDARYYRVGRID